MNSVERHDRTDEERVTSNNPSGNSWDPRMTVKRLLYLVDYIFDEEEPWNVVLKLLECWSRKHGVQKSTGSGNALKWSEKEHLIFRQSTPYELW